MNIFKSKRGKGPRGICHGVVIHDVTRSRSWRQKAKGMEGECEWGCLLEVYSFGFIEIERVRSVDIDGALNRPSAIVGAGIGACE